MCVHVEEIAMIMNIVSNLSSHSIVSGCSRTIHRHLLLLYFHTLSPLYNDRPMSHDNVDDV